MYDARPTLRCKRFEVATDSFARHAQPAGKVGDADEAVSVEGLHDLVYATDSEQAIHKSRFWTKWFDVAFCGNCSKYSLPRFVKATS
ncbi:hypothetical protein BSU04_35380 [Caballeronia sordidicola]|uniref:Uncharacterized protein n=1 Tax=Caballeronia sordidicola TaxID=196367 RepID=A0A226WRE8_CABSO|nr:hypothetical protein BSU04_35380 [Caballeronia sordidicola]